MPNKWAQYEEKPAASKWDQYAEDAPPPSAPSLSTRIQNSFDTNTRTSPSEPLLETGLKSVVGAIGTPFVHPLNTAKGLLDMIPSSPDLPEHSLVVNGKNYSRDPENPLVKRGVQAYTDAKDGGVGYSATKLGGELLGSVALGEGAGAAVKGVGPAIDTVRNARIADPDAAALRGLQLGPRSPKALRTLSAVETARPFLQGAKSLEDLQSRIPAAKSEIWSPYDEALKTVGDKPTGFGSVQDLENERLQTSALLRNLKSRNPEAINLAQQKGLTEADLLTKEKQLNSLLNSELSATGIDPRAIRQNYGAVSRIGQQISGRSTLIEEPKPFGLGKLAAIDLAKPLKSPGIILDAGRDILAGRPILKGKPTDVAIGEAFRKSGPKPDLGRVLTPEELNNPFLNKSKLKSSISR